MKFKEHRAPFEDRAFTFLANMRTLGHEHRYCASTSCTTIPCLQPRWSSCKRSTPPDKRTCGKPLALGNTQVTPVSRLDYSRHWHLPQICRTSGRGGKIPKKEEDALAASSPAGTPGRTCSGPRGRTGG
eukprot:1157376-Pelagomonas_calceolata.AAC.3